MRILLSMTLAAGLCACDNRPQEVLSLVDHADWALLDQAADPFDDRPSGADCDPLSWGAEFLGLEPTLFVDTLGCNYITAATPMLWDVLASDTLKLRVWHFELSAPEPAEAHVAVAVDGAVLWEEYFPIPAESALSIQEWEAGLELDEGAQVTFHAHNHGGNSYNFIEFSARPAGVDPD